jgi:DNA polymerase-3 subunit delta
MYRMNDRKNFRGNTFRAVIDNINNGHVAPCYLLFGDEEYLIKEALNEIIECILPGNEKALNLFWMDGDRADMESIGESILTPPLLPGRKVVAVTDTSVFTSRASAPTVVKEIVNTIDNDPDKAARAFGIFLQMTGWRLEELKDDGWTKISDDDWREAVGNETVTGREKWLPKIVDIAAGLGVSPKQNVDETDLFEQILGKGFPEGNCLIFTAAFVDKRKKIFKLFDDYGVTLQFSKVKSKDEQKRLFLNASRDVLARRGKTLSPGAVAALGRKTGFNLRESMGELEKVITYTGDKGLIDESDIDVITEKTKEDSVFDLTSALVSRNLEKALETLRDLLEQGLHHLMILTMIAREIRLLLQGKILIRSEVLPPFSPRMSFNQFQQSIYPHIKDLGNGKGRKTKSLVTQHPYVIYNALRNSEQFTYDELIGYLDTISSIDVTLKTTGRDPKLLVERLLVEICR